MFKKTMKAVSMIVVIAMLTAFVPAAVFANDEFGTAAEAPETDPFGRVYSGLWDFGAQPFTVTESDGSIHPDTRYFKQNTEDAKSYDVSTTSILPENFNGLKYSLFYDTTAVYSPSNVSFEDGFEGTWKLKTGGPSLADKGNRVFSFLPSMDGIVNVYATCGSTKEDSVLYIKQGTEEQSLTLPVNDTSILKPVLSMNILANDEVKIYGGGNISFYAIRYTGTGEIAPLPTASPMPTPEPTASPIQSPAPTSSITEPDHSEVPDVPLSPRVWSFSKAPFIVTESDGTEHPDTNYFPQNDSNPERYDITDDSFKNTIDGLRLLLYGFNSGAYQHSDKTFADGTSCSWQLKMYGNFFFTPAVDGTVTVYARSGSTNYSGEVTLTQGDKSRSMILPNYSNEPANTPLAYLTMNVEKDKEVNIIIEGAIYMIAYTDNTNPALPFAYSVNPDETVTISRYYYGNFENGGTKIDIPAEVDGKPVTTIENDAFYSRNYLDILVPESVKEIKEDAFLNTSNYSFRVYPGSYAEQYAIENYIPYTHVLDESKTNLNVNVTDDYGNPITEGYTINWFEKGSSTVISSGNKLTNADKSKEYEYMVILDDSLKYSYYQPDLQSVGKASGDLTCVLTKISKVNIRGEVANTDGEPVRDVSITFCQNFGSGESVRTTVKGNLNGGFEANLYNVPTSVVFENNEYYTVTKNILRDRTNTSDANMGKIKMQRLPSDKITLSVKVKNAVKQNEAQSETSLQSFSGLTFTLFDKTDGTVIQSAQAQYPNIVFDGNSVSAGDEIEIRAVSDNSDMTAEPVCVTLDKTKTASAEIVFVENGKISVGKTDGVSKATMMLFDENGSFVKSYAADGSFMTEGMSAGKYKAVFIKRTNFLKSVDFITVLDELGLAEGTDYTAVDVLVRNGEISEISNIIVPDLDETKLYYTIDDNTGFTANYSNIIIWKCITLRAEYEIDPSHPSSDEVVTIDIPDGITVPEGSVTVDGSAAMYSVNGGKMTVPVGKSKGTVRFYGIATQKGDYSLTAYLSFKSGSLNCIQPIGTAGFGAQAMKLNAPSEVGTPNVLVSGIALPKSEITVYDNDVIVGRTTANSNGRWVLSYELSDASSFAYHTLYADISHQGYNGTTRTEEKLMVYDVKAPQVSKVTVYNYAHPPSDVTRNVEYVTEIDFLHSDTRTPNYRFKPSCPSFSFVVEFTGGSNDSLSDVAVVTYNTSGEATYVKCSYDPNRNAWIGTHEYTSYNIPANIEVNYNDNSEYQVNLLVDESDIELSDKCFEEIFNYVKENVEADVVYESDDYCLIKLYDSDTSRSLGIYVFTYLEYNNQDFSDPGWQKLEEGDDTVLFKVDDFEGNNYVRIADTQYKAAYGFMPCVLRDIGPDNSSAARLSGLFDDKASAAALDDTSAELLKEALQTAVDMAVDTDFSFDPEKTYDFLKENTPGLQEIDDAVNYYQMKKQIAGFREEVHAFNDTLLDQFLYAKCPDGSYRLSKDDMERYGSVLSSMKMSIDQSFDSCDDNLEAFRLQLLTTCVTDLATMVMGNCLKYFAGGKVKVNSKNAKYFESNLSDKELKKFGINSANAKKIRNFAKNTNDFVEKYGDEIAGFAQNLIDKYGEGVFPEKLESECLRNSINLERDKLLDNLNQIMHAMMNDYKKCDQEPDDQPEPAEKTSPQMPINGQMDPSGYICEAVASNRIEGVTATAYYLDDELDNFGVPTGNKVPRVWDAADYDQINPMLSDVNGEYGWDVPEGQWQVKYEKEGYETAYSEWLPVPPPQTEVHTAMVSKAAPVVDTVSVYSDNVKIKFSQYMQINSVNTNNVRIFSNGTAISGTIEPYDAEVSYNDPNVMYARTFVFTPSVELSGSVTAQISGVCNYNGAEIESLYSSEIPVVYEPESIESADSIDIAYNSGALLDVSVLPSEAAEGLTISAVSSASSIASPVNESSVIGQDGRVNIMINGNLPGSCDIILSVSGTDIKKIVKANVAGIEKTNNPVCEKVTANIPNGTVAAYGTKVALSTATEGAEIYYTLDGTCPCTLDSPSRMRYTEPIEITGDTFIIAYAIKDGHDDSPTSGFMYSVDSGRKLIPVEVSGAGAGHVLIVAAYDGDVMVGRAEQTASGTGADVVELECDTSAKTVKIMEWESLESMKPVKPAEEREIN